MIFGNLDIHGAAEAVPTPDGGYTFLRYPASADRVFNDQGKRMNRSATGVEIRFAIGEGDARLTLYNIGAEYSSAVLYYGDFAADWPETNKIIRNIPTEIVIKPPRNLPLLKKIAEEGHHRFDPTVVRLYLDSPVCILKAEGDISVPKPEQVPAKTYLAYGSSITHGSIALTRPHAFVNCVGEELGYDALNMGMAGAACLEKEAADYLASVPFDIATVEMGINILGIPADDFEARVRRFLPILAESHPAAKIFAIDVFYCHDDVVGGGKAAAFRKIVRRVTEELQLPNIVYVNGLDILPDGTYLTDGLVHPAPRGVRLMADNLVSVIRQHLK